MKVRRYSVVADDVALRKTQTSLNVEIASPGGTNNRIDSTAK